MKRLTAVLAFALLAGCADQPTMPSRSPAQGGPAHKSLYGTSWVSVSCSSATVGGYGQCTAIGYDAYGRMTTTGGSWWSGNPAVATVNSAGTVFGRSPGGATIYALVDGVQGSGVVQVLAAPVMSSVKVTPTSATVYVGGTVQLTAAPYDQYGNKMSGTYTATWSSDAPSVAPVSSTGVVSGAAVGSTTIRATINGLTGTSSVTVSSGTTSGGGGGGGGCFASATRPGALLPACP